MKKDSGRFVDSKRKLTGAACAVLMCILSFTAALTGVYSDTISVEGVVQGTDGIHYAQDAPIADIYIDQDALNDPSKAAAALLSSYPGFRLVDLSYISSHTYNAGALSGLSTNPAYPENTLYLVYDESADGAEVITGSAGTMNTFSGDIVSFTYPDAATLPGNEKGNVVITYSNISFPMQSNFGQHANVGVNNIYSDPDNYMGSTGSLTDADGNSMKMSDFWEYDTETGRGRYKQPGMYTVGTGCYIHTWNNLVDDRRYFNPAGDYSFTTRNGLTLDIKVQITDSSGNVVDGKFFYSMKDIDVSRQGNANFAYLHDYDNQNYYSETVRIDSGIDSESKIYIPGDTDSKKYQYTDVYKDSVGTVFRGKGFDGGKGEPDPGTTYSGFSTVIDNKQGLGITYWAGGAASAVVRTWIFTGHTFYRLKSSTGTGGMIKTTTKGNNTDAGDLTDGGTILGSTSIEVAGGKTVKYRIIPRKGYWLDSVTVDGTTIGYDSLPDEGGSVTITLNSGTDKERTGTLTNAGNGEYVFTFPDTVADHEIHVDWDGDYYFEKVWVNEEGDSIDIEAVPYTFDGEKLFAASGLKAEKFTVYKSDDGVTRTDNGDGTWTWLIKKTDLPIETDPGDDGHDDDHHNPLYWFATEDEIEYFTTSYSNDDAAALEYYESGEELPNGDTYDGSQLTVLNGLIEKSEGNAYLSMKASDYGVITNSLSPKALSVSKKTSGNYRNAEDEFSFTAVFTGLEENKTFSTEAGTTGDESSFADAGSFKSDSNGEASVTFIIKSDQTWRAPEITPTAKVTVTEAASEYIAEFTVTQNGNTIQTGSNTSDGAALATSSISMDRDAGVTFTNTKNRVIPTGVRTTDSRSRNSLYTPLAGLIALMLLSELCILYRLRKRR